MPGAPYLVALAAIAGLAACRGGAERGAALSPSAPDVSTPPSAAMTSDAKRSDDGCAPSASEPAQLTSYLEAEVPAVYWLELTYEAGQWLPARALPMPRHHATRLELGNLGDFPVLAQPTALRVRATLELLSRDVRQVPGQHQWRTTYHARVLTVCPLP